MRQDLSREAAPMFGDKIAGLFVVEERTTEKKIRGVCNRYHIPGVCKPTWEKGS